MIPSITSIGKVWPLELAREEQSYAGALCVLRTSLAELTPLSEEALSAAEQERYDRIPADRRRFSFLCGRIAAKRALTRLSPEPDFTRIDIGEGVFSQPVVRGAAFHGTQVSIAHTEGIGAAVAFPEEHPMGIDVEIVRPELERTVGSQMTAAEKEFHRQLPYAAAAGFALMWSIKESLSKVLKCGLMTPFQILEVTAIDATQPVIVSTFGNFAQYKTLSVVRGDVVLSLTLPKKTALSLDFLAAAGPLGD